MGTRIQNKSRPTKRPLGVVASDGSPAVSQSKYNLPRPDKRGYPFTKGLPSPTLLKNTKTFPTAPAGLTLIGTTYTVAAYAGTGNGQLAVKPATVINISYKDAGGTDRTAAVNAITAGQTIWFGGYYGTWRAVMASAVNNTGYRAVTVNTIVKAGVVGVSQSVRLYAGTASAQSSYVPGDHTIAEVQAYVTANMAEAQAVVDAERIAPNRVTLVAWLAALPGVI